MAGATVAVRACDPAVSDADLSALAKRCAEGAEGLEAPEGEALARLRTMQELRPFLIHGLYRSKRAFAVAIADRALWVDSADHHEDASPVTRQPLVIYIDEVPPDVYVTVGEAAKAAAAARHSDQ